MKRILMMAGALAVLSSPVLAEDTTNKSMTLGINGFEFYSFATSQSQKNGVVAGMILNVTDNDLSIVRAESSVAENVELHTHLEEDGVMKMREVESYSVKAHEDIQLSPSSKHIMLFDLKAPLKQGDLFSIRFYDQNGANMEVPVLVRAPGDIPPVLRSHAPDPEHNDDGHGDDGHTH